MTTPWQPDPQQPRPLPRVQPWPVAEGRADTVPARLLVHRIVLLHGRLDSDRATEAAATLLMLDAEGRKPVALRVDSPDADLGAALLLADTIDLMLAPVHLMCAGELGGPATVLAAAADRVEAAPHARFRLTEPRMDVDGTAAQVAAVAAQQASMLDQLCARLARRTGRTAAGIRADLRPPGRFLTAAEAVEYGLVDRVAVSS